MQNLEARITELVDTPQLEYLLILTTNVSNFSHGTWNHARIPDMSEPNLQRLINMSYFHQQRSYRNDYHGIIDRDNSADVDREITIMNKVIKFHRSRDLIIKTLENELEGNK